MTIDEFKAAILSCDHEELLYDHILPPPFSHVEEKDIEYVKQKISGMFSIDVLCIKIFIVGSANLGFSITEKRKGDLVKPRFREFSPESDIDVAVVCDPIFNAVLDDISICASRTLRMPWRSEQLGDYLTHGWIRPDKVPYGHSIGKIEKWRDTFRAMRLPSQLNRRSVNGGLYRTIDDLARYQLRSIRECKQFLEENV